MFRRAAFRSLVLLALLASCAVRVTAQPAAEDVALLSLARLMTEDAQRYEHGECVEREPSMAMQLYCRAARYGHAEAQYRLGWMLANGRGVPRDEPLAGLWFAMAAEQGHEYAQRMLKIFKPSRHLAHPPCLSAEVQAQQLAEPNNPEPTASESGVDWSRGSAARQLVVNLVEKLAPNYGIDPNFALAVISIESGFNFNARSNRNAQGLMQLIPGTAARFGVRDAFDPGQNVRGGLSYLRWLLATFRGDVSLAAAAYNAGERAVERYRGVPPYPETLNYVAKVLSLYKRTRHSFDATVAKPSPIVPAPQPATRPTRRPP